MGVSVVTREPGKPNPGEVEGSWAAGWRPAGWDANDELNKFGPSAVRGLIEGARVVEERPLIVDPKAPLHIAQTFANHFYTRKGKLTLRHHVGIFYRYTGTHYAAADEADIRAEIYRFLERAQRSNGKTTSPFNPKRTSVTDVMDALKAISNLPAEVAAPAWIEPTPDLPAAELIACQNGLLHLPTGQVIAHSADFFTHSALEFAYDPDAPQPKGWLHFMADLWPDDPEAVATLAEVFGYCLASLTAQQKLFMLFGPRRSGKGTIGRVLTGLLGKASVVGPTLASLTTHFGLEPLIAKRLAIIADARLGRRTDHDAIVERLLSISGEDGLTIDRKHVPAWTGRLRVRFLILTNVLPRLDDVSGALASRFIILKLTCSFYGNEDPTLTDRLLAELPGILNWAIDGWRRLNERGHFLQPTSSAAIVQQFEDLSSGIGLFLQDKCEVAPGRLVSVEQLYQAWRDWCSAQGRDHPGTKQSFGRDLHAAIPDLKVRQPRNGESRDRVYEGVGLK